MANRARKLQLRQLGREVTPGTAVSANLIDPHLMLNINLDGDDSDRVVPTGYLVPTGMVAGAYWVTGDYSEPFGFTTAHIIFDSALKKVTATGAGTAKTRVWTPSANALDTRQYYSGEGGQSGAVEKAKYLFINGIKWQISKTDAAPMTGDVMAQWNGLATSLTGSPTVLASSLVPKIAWNVYNNTTFVGLGSSPTQLTDHASYAADWGPFFDVASFINSASPGWDAPGLAEDIKWNVDVTVPKDVTGTDYTGVFTLAKKLAGTPIFIRLSATGTTVIESGTPDIYESFIIDMCLRIRGNPTPSDIGPFAGLTWPCELSLDATSGKYLEITTVSTVA